MKFCSIAKTGKSRVEWVNTCKFETRISELPYTLFSEDQITSVKLHFLPRKLRGILVFSQLFYQLKVYVLQLGVLWNLEQNLKDKHWQWLGNQNLALWGTLQTLCVRALFVSCLSLTRPLHCTTADKQCTADCTCKIHEIPRIQKNIKEN